MRTSRLALLALSLATVYAQQQLDAAVTSLLGPSVTGQEVALSRYSFRYLANETHALVTLNLSMPLADVGWIGTGAGTMMANMDAYIFWPTTSGWTMSHRNAPGHTMPMVPRGQTAATLTAAGIRLVTAPTLSSTDASLPYSCVSFVRPLELSSSTYTSSSNVVSYSRSSQPFIYAFSSDRPISTAFDAPLQRHDIGAHGSFEVDFGASFEEEASTTGATGEAIVPVVQVEEGSSSTWTRYDRLVVAHAAIGSIAWLLLAPAVILFTRLGRHLASWLAVHRAGLILVSLLTIIAVALGITAVSQSGSDHFSATHQRIGLVLLIAVVLQVILGVMARQFKDAKRTSRPWWNILHMAFGLTLVVLAYVQVYEGMALYKRPAPKAVVAVVSILVGISAAAYLAAMVLLIVRRRKEGREWSEAAAGLGRSSKSVESRETSEVDRKAG